jgi:hypothetical protein
MRLGIVLGGALALSGCGLNEMRDIARETRDISKRSSGIIAKARDDERLVKAYERLINPRLSSNFRVAAAKTVFKEAPEDALPGMLALPGLQYRSPGVQRTFFTARFTPEELRERKLESNDPPSKTVDLPNVSIVGAQNHERLGMATLRPQDFQVMWLAVRQSAQELYDLSIAPTLDEEQRKHVDTLFPRLVAIGTAIGGAMTVDTFENMVDVGGKRTFITEEERRVELATLLRETAKRLSASRNELDELEGLIRARLFEAGK